MFFNRLTEEQYHEVYTDETHDKVIFISLMCFFVTADYKQGMRKVGFSKNTVV